MMNFIMYWALAGFLIPVAIVIIGVYQGVFQWPYLAVALWPSWILLGATIDREWTAFGIAVVVISIGINVVLYSGVGAVLWLLWSWFSKLLKQ